MVPRVERLLKRLRLGRPVVAENVTLIHTRVDDQPVTFCVNMENDPIQRNHRRGTFYELKELRELQSVFPAGGTFVDIGANVGNHTLFAALFLKAGRVIPFEPNPKAYGLLVENVLLNGLGEVVDLSRLGVGVSDKAEGGFAMQKKKRNLGSARMLPGEGDIAVFPADDLLSDETPAMIKIDVEGMELSVLGGLDKTIATHRPVLLVEVDNENEDGFFARAEAAGYVAQSTVQRYRLNKNHLMVPKETVPQD